MKVALIGGTGFVGGYLVDALLERSFIPRMLVRPGSEARVWRPDETEQVSGGVSDPRALEAVTSGCDAVIYNIGLLREFPSRGVTFQAMHVDGVRASIEAARTVGVRRFLLMSANGVRANGTPYQRTKYEAEVLLRNSGLDWTVFRPSVIFGPPRGRMEFCTQLLQQMILPPLPAPLFFEGLNLAEAGRFRMSPVYAGDVAAVFAEALVRAEAVGRVYPLCGPESPTWAEIVRAVATAVGKRKLALPAPAFGIKCIAAPLERFSFFPLTRDQLTMLLEGNACESGETFREFGIEPARFDPASLAYLRH